MKKDCNNCGGLGCPTCHGGLVKLPTSPYNIVLGFTTRKHLHRFLAQQPRVLPLGSRPKPLSSSQRMLAGLLWLCLAPLLLLGFLLAGERSTLKA